MRKVTIRVTLPEQRIPNTDLEIVLDMLRYAGLLDGNVKGFPKVIEYGHAGDFFHQIDRWASFGITAEAIER